MNDSGPSESFLVWVRILPASMSFVEAGEAGLLNAAVAASETARNARSTLDRTRVVGSSENGRIR